MSLIKPALPIIIVVFLSACSTAYHHPIGSIAQPTIYDGFLYDTAQPHVLPQSNPTIVGLSISGGGSRSAYLSAAILREIHRSHISIIADESPSQPDLISQINFVSTVSGGSLSGAYFVLNIDTLKFSDPNEIPWKTYTDKMSKNFRNREWYVSGIFNPVTWFKVLFSDYNRGNIAREDYDETLYSGATLDSLPSQPALYINALDVGNHVRFIFSKQYIENEATGHSESIFRSPKDFTAENDLSWCRVDPKSIKIADAVYASSAYPVAYPHLPLNHFGNKIAYRGQYIFLADGGLADNSGLLTLFSEMKKSFVQSPKSHAVLGIFIDASLADLNSGSSYQDNGTEENHAWRNTYFGHGIDSLEAAIDTHEDVILRYLEHSGVAMDTINISDDPRLLRPIDSNSQAEALSWRNEFRSGKLQIRPTLIKLRLRNIADAYHTVWSSNSQDWRKEDPELINLFKQSGIEESPDEFSSTISELSKRLAKIPTDFNLSNNHKRLLDLSAYLLVHGELEPSVSEWNEMQNKIQDAQIKGVGSVLH